MRALWLVVLWAAAVPAWAQTPPAAQPDSDAILRALDAINRRLDRLENKDRKPERRAPPPARPAVAVATPRATQPPPKSVHGWFVHLMPWTESRDDVSIGGFSGPAHDFNFDMHSRYVPGQNRFIYNGRSLLHINNDEEYTFAVELLPYTGPYPGDNALMVSYNCSVEMLISGNRILAGATTFNPSIRRVNQDVYRSQLITGRTRLQPPGPGQSHPIEFKTDCWETSQPKLTYFDDWLPTWKKNRFRILFKTAADIAPRPFQPDELWYVGQP